MRYEGNIFRPPSEANSLIVQVTIGCAHNDCTFCSMFKDKRFRVRLVSDVIEDLEGARRAYAHVDRIFLADGDAISLGADKLLSILSAIRRLFPECRRVGVYGSPQDILNKRPRELEALRDAGLGIVYIGAESGSDEVLRAVKKGVTAAEITEAVQRTEAAGLVTSVTFISGLAGEERWEDHAIMTGRMISAAEPSYVGLLTLMVAPGAPLYRDVREGRFSVLPPLGVVDETLLLLEHTEVSGNCVFRSNHASNYISLKGTLPADRDAMIESLRAARGHEDLLKKDWMRML